MRAAIIKCEVKLEELKNKKEDLEEKYYYFIDKDMINQVIKASDDIVCVNEQIQFVKQILKLIKED